MSSDTEGHDDTSHWGPAGVPPLDQVPDAVWSRVLSLALDPDADADAALVPDEAAFDGVVTGDGSSSDPSAADASSPVDDTHGDDATDDGPGSGDPEDDPDDDSGDGTHDHHGPDDADWMSDDDHLGGDADTGLHETGLHEAGLHETGPHDVQPHDVDPGY